MTRRWASSKEFLQEVELRQIARDERRKQEARTLRASVRLGVATPAEVDRLTGKIQPKL